MAETTDKRIAIILSTYNGAQYLPAQLESLAAQSMPDWVLYWRDDGSSDKTIGIMNTFAAGPGAGRCVRLGEPDHLGATASFMALLQQTAPTGLPVAFADQDDVWLPEKLALALAALDEETAPVLYCTRQMLVDERLARLAELPELQRPPSFPNALTQNIATGCTMVLNPSAAHLVAGSQAPTASLHDWWSYLLVTGNGGRVIADPALTVLYRQHSENLVGAPRSSLRRARGAMRRGPGVFMAVMRAHVEGLLAQRDLLTEDALRVLAVVDRGLSGGLAARLTALRLPELRRQTWLETLLFRWWFLTG